MSRKNPYGSYAGGYREAPARRTGLTKKGERMVRDIEADSSYGEDAPEIAYRTVYARAKDRPGTGLVHSDWAREHGYPSPNPSGAAQEALYVVTRGMRGSEQLSELARHPELRGIHYGRLESAAKELDRKGYIEFDGVEVGPVSNPAEVDEHAVRELSLYIENDSDIYRQHTMPVFKNLSRKWRRGTFDASKAPKAFSYVVEAGAKKYHKEFGGGGSWHHTFPKPVRDTVAQAMAAEFVQEAELGNLYDD